MWLLLTQSKILLFPSTQSSSCSLLEWVRKISLELQNSTWKLNYYQIFEESLKLKKKYHDKHKQKLPLEEAKMFQGTENNFKYM